MYKQTHTSEDKVIIKVEGKKFPCSRAKLCENSDYFNVMFNGNFTEKDKKTVTIQDVTEKAFQNCLFIIDKKIDSLEYDQLLNTLQCACMLQFEKIKKDCIQRFIDDLRTEYCLDVWHMTEFLDIHPLCEHAKCRALMEFNRIKDSDSILQINLKQLHSYLANTLIYCDCELDIFEAGLKWWYENSPKLEETENWSEKDTTQHLYTILSCVDFKSVPKSDVNNMLTYPDVCDNKEIQRILKAILSLIDDPATEIDAEIEKQVKNLFFNSKSRDRALLPCIVTSEYPWEPDQTKRTRLEREVNISYYDHKTKSMLKLFSTDYSFATKCSPTLNGCKILPYRENLILFGGENSYGSSNWNTSIWLYHSFKSQWELLTKMPKERRHFQACIVDDKLFIIGGTGKYRIKAHDEMMFYDFRKDRWGIDIHLPHSWLDVRACEYKNQLLILPAVVDNKYAYVFCLASYGWAKLTISYPPNFKFNFKRNFVLFSKDSSVYLKGSHFLEMKVQTPYLKIKSLEPAEEMYGDKINYYLNNNNLYIFSKHASLDSDVIFQLHCFNLTTKQNELVVQINDSVDQWWHIKRGCFSYFHFSLTKDVDCISEFPS